MPFSGIKPGTWRIGDVIKPNLKGEPERVRAINEVCALDRSPHEHITTTLGNVICGSRLEFM